MEDIGAEFFLPTAHIQPTIHNRFPTEKISLVDHSIEIIEPCVIYPESADLNARSSLVFNIHDAAGHYLDLSSMQLEVTLSVQRPDGAALGDDDAFYLTNNLLSSLFPIRKCFVNNVCVETQYSGHHIGRIKQLLYTNNALTANRGQSRGLFVLESAKEASPIDEDLCGQNGA